jgi:hypothetical protein
MILFERDLAAWQARREQRRQELLQEALTAMHRYEQTQKVSHRRAALQAIQLCSLAETSGTRPATLLRIIAISSPEIFWSALMASCSMCDATWSARNLLLRAMKDAGMPAVALLSRAQRQFFEALPAQVQVFRGCSRPRVRAVSWTCRSQGRLLAVRERLERRGRGRNHCWRAGFGAAAPRSARPHVALSRRPQRDRDWPG